MSDFNRKEYLDNAQRLIPWGSSTCSKAPSYPPYDPAAIVRGKGCRVWDIEGREFIDFRNGLGPVTLGYAYPEVNEAIARQLECGAVFGNPSVLEPEVAQIISEIIPCAEMVRFLKTGGEAVAACIRLARGYTGRDHIIQIGYNGWLNSLSSGGAVLPGRLGSSSGNGIPAAISDLHHSAGWNSMDTIREITASVDGNVAAVVVAADYGRLEEGREFYPALRKYTKENGILLIFDEIVTGFRISLGGVQEYFGVTPDLAVFSKGMANGMPISVFCGSREVMKCCDRGGGVVVSSTFGGEALSLAAAKATINIYRRDNVIGHIWNTGKTLWSGANKIFEKHALPVRVLGAAPCPTFTDLPDGGDIITRLMSACYKHGISFYNVSYVNFSHKADDIAEVLEKLEAACTEL
ncbi:MAG: aminotransferase class III-fold pyridoxal phosphate-dependent enzyme [Oscillospiraceae bacterium]|nr:aminotransferase class III-fold pyridoxal phosphate-dependent enzyme [Oscillospiraceae bacterium]